MTDNGFVPTPAPVTDWAVSVLFAEPPTKSERVLLPGCGTGNFGVAVNRYASYRGHPCPSLVGVEQDTSRAATAAERFDSAPIRPDISSASATQLECTYPPNWEPSHTAVDLDATVYEDDYLTDPPAGPFEYVIANPPFVKYNDLDSERRNRYRRDFHTTEGQFNLYAPFVEQMCDQLSQSGTLVCILPEDILLSTNSALRHRLRQETIHYVRPLPKAVFPGHTIRTCAFVISRGPSLTADSSFVVDTWNCTTTIRQLLEGVGVPHSELDSAIDSYLERVKGLQTSVQARRRSQGPDGGYDVNPQAANADHQADVTAWG